MQEIRRAARAGLRRPRLAEVLPQVLVRRLLRPEHVEFGPLRVINEDRVPPGAGLRHAQPSRHGNHQLRAGGRARAQGLDRQRLDDPPGRRAAHERRARRARTASSIPRAASRVHFLQIWIQPNVHGHRAELRGEALLRGREARPAAADRLAGPGRRLGARSTRTRASTPACSTATRAQNSSSRRAARLRARCARRRHGERRCTGSGRCTEVDGQRQVTLQQGRDAEVLVFDLP